MAYLILKQGDQAGQKVDVIGDKVSVGRGNQSDIRILERSVSRNHAIISRSPDGNHIIKDVGSSYGTFVNGKRIAQEKLTDKCTVKLGSATLEYRKLSVDFDVSEQANNDAQSIESIDQPTVPGEAVQVGESEDGFTILQIMTDAEDPHVPIPTRQNDDALNEANKRLRTAYELSEVISYSFNLQELYKKILKAIFSTIKVERACILLLDEESGEIIPQASMDSFGVEQDVPYSTTIVRKVIENGESLLLNNAQTEQELDTAVSIFAHNIRSAICVPIRTREKILGVLNADASGASLFNKSDLQLFTLIGNQAGTVIQNARLVEENIKAARLAAVGQTVASLAHCIKNILQGLKGGAFMVDEGFNTDNMDMIQAAWPLVKGSQQKITELVMNMLDYSKERKPAYQFVELQDNMQNIYDLMLERSAEKNVKFFFEYDEETPKVECDPMGIYRATLNLVTNAIDAVEENRGKVKLNVCPAEDGKNLHIQVIDNGTGIPEDVLEKLFEAFHSTKDSKGTGLGLAVSKKIANEHKGDIIVKTILGKGTTFIIQIPIKRPE